MTRDVGLHDDVNVILLHVEVSRDFCFTSNDVHFIRSRCFPLLIRFALDASRVAFTGRCAVTCDAASSHCHRDATHDAFGAPDTLSVIVLRSSPDNGAFPCWSLRSHRVVTCDVGLGALSLFLLSEAPFVNKTFCYEF